MTENWFELITGTKIQAEQQTLMLAPYQTLWISNLEMFA
jgi:sucrose phosphorylase